jgi:hypothetical protein
LNKQDDVHPSLLNSRILSEGSKNEWSNCT